MSKVVGWLRGVLKWVNIDFFGKKWYNESSLELFVFKLKGRFMKNEFKEDENLEEMVKLVEIDSDLLDGCDIEQLKTISSYLEKKKQFLEDKIGED